MKIVQSRKFVGKPAVGVCCVGKKLFKTSERTQTKTSWQSCPDMSGQSVTHRSTRPVQDQSKPNYSVNVQGGHRFPALAEELFANDGCWERMHFLQGHSPWDATPCSSRSSYLHAYMGSTKWARWVLEKESTWNWEGIMVGWKGQELKGREWRV